MPLGEDRRFPVPRGNQPAQPRVRRGTLSGDGADGGIERVRRGLATLMVLAFGLAVWSGAAIAPRTVVARAASQIAQAPEPPCGADAPCAEKPAARTLAGFASHPWRLQGEDLEASLNLMAQAGARWLRLDFQWAEVEPQRGHYRWDTYERIVTAAAARGIGIIAMVPQYRTPPWASRWSQAGGLPDRLQEFTQVTQALAAHFRGRIAYYEIGNEPNSSKYWLPRPSAAQYVEFLKAGALGVRRGDLAARVVTGAAAPWGPAFVDPVSWMRQLYDLGAAAFFDAVGAHPYSLPYGPDDDRASFGRLSLVRDVRAVMLSRGDGAKPVIITEFGWTTAQGRMGVSEEVQAQYVARAFEKIRTEYPFVAVACLYTFRDMEDAPGAQESNFGVVTTSFAPKPAYFAYQAAIRESLARPLARLP